MVEIKHSTQETAGLYCDGRECFEVLTRKGKKVSTVSYWCAARHSHFVPFDMSAEDCPRKPFKYKPPKFAI